MKTRRGAVCLVSAALIFSGDSAALGQQRTPEVRRAQPVNEPPVAKAVPFDSPGAFGATAPQPAAGSTFPTSRTRNRDQEQPPPESRRPNTEAPDRRQLDYANGLFSRKLYDLAVPEYEKFLSSISRRSRSIERLFLPGAMLSRAQSQRRRPDQFSKCAG